MNEEIQNTELNQEEPTDELIEELADEAESADEQLGEENEFPSELELTEMSDEESESTSIIVSEETLSVETDGSDETDESEEAHEAEDSDEEVAIEEKDDDQITATREELKPVIEALMFVADEPLPFKQLCKILGDVPETDVQAALEELVADYEARNSGLDIREIAGGWRISTRPQHHEFIRKYLKSRPSARLSLPALETLAVIAYKQPITIPEILEIRGVSSSSAIKTLLEKRLIVTKGRKDTVGKPMLYGTSKEFLIQFGLKDLNELPSFEDFEDLAQ